MKESDAQESFFSGVQSITEDMPELRYSLKRDKHKYHS